MFRGIVIDSATFEELQNVIISVKHSERRTISSLRGEFTLQANNVDTLLFALLGYHSVELPLYFEEDILLIRMSEQIRILDEITIRATRLYPNEIVNRTKESPKMMSALEGVFAPFDYFWSLEREKRKLARIIEDNNKTQTYLQVINDPIVKTIMMKAYDVTELVYYETVAAFNQQQKFIAYASDPEEIMEALHDFFKKNSK
ncbi:MAG: carboxypeptidase-like regulatory domain-containing protein [Bacteroidota bacterium]